MALTARAAISVLATARWQAFRNSLRQRRARFELAATVLLVVFGALVAVGAGLGIAATAYLAVTKGRTEVVGFLIWSIFGTWQLGPLLTEGGSPALNFNEIAKYPLTFRLYYLMNAAYGLVEPFALLGIAWLGFLWSGITFARPPWSVRAAAALAMFTLMNLLLNRLIYGWVQRVVTTRRGRERFVLGLLLGGASVQVFFSVLLPRYSNTQAARLLTEILNSVTPPGLAAGVVTGHAPAIGATIGLILWAALIALLLRRQLWGTYVGELAGEKAEIRDRTAVEPGWRVPGLSDCASAIVEKEVRYVARDPRTILAFFTAPFFAVVMMLSSSMAEDVMGQRTAGDPTIAYMGISAYVLLALGTLAYNSFSYESRGFQLWQMAPVSFRTVLLAKNAIIFVLLVAGFALVCLVIRFRYPLAAGDFLLLAAAFVYAAIAVIAVGNRFSVRYPMRVEFGTMSTKKASSAAILFSMLAQVAIMISVWAVFQLAQPFGLDRPPLYVFGLLIVVALRLYVWSLASAAAYARRHGDEIASALA